MSLNVSAWRDCNHKEVRGEEKKSKKHLWWNSLSMMPLLLVWFITAHFPCIIRAQGLHALFAVTFFSHLQKEELIYWLRFFLFTVTISSNGHFLTNEDLELTLMQNSSHSQPHLSIKLFNINNNIVTTEILQEEAPQKYILKLKQLKAVDSGTWMCHVYSNSPSINQNISFDVKVLGMWQQKCSLHTDSETSAHEPRFHFPPFTQGCSRANFPGPPTLQLDCSAAWALSHTSSRFLLQAGPKRSPSPWGLFFSALVSLRVLPL